MSNTKGVRDAAHPFYGVRWMTGTRLHGQASHSFDGRDDVPKGFNRAEADQIIQTELRPTWIIGKPVDKICCRLTGLLAPRIG